MGSVKLSDIGALLAPGPGQTIIWSIFLYIIFFFALITLFTMPEKNMVPTLLVAGVLLFAIVAKLSVNSLALGKRPILQKTDFGMFVINVGMFVFPLIAVGMTRARKNRAAIPAIITALTAAVYFFAYWFFVQQVK